MNHNTLPASEGADAEGTIPPAVRHPPFLLWAGGALATAGLVVLVAGMMIAHGYTFVFDRAILLALREPGALGVPVGPHWLKPTMISITALGSGTVLTLTILVTLGALVVVRLWFTAGLMLVATVSGSLAVDLVKTLVARARPMVVPHLVDVTSLSFPSGHSANSAIVYLTIATLLAQVVRARSLRTYILVVAALLVTAIGISRLYLGVHWPSDVLAGWSFGTLWALAWWAIGAHRRIARAA